MFVSEIQSPDRRPKSMAVPDTSTWDTPLARALYAYLSSGENQLSFLEGDVIALMGRYHVRNPVWLNKLKMPFFLLRGNYFGQLLRFWSNWVAVCIIFNATCLFAGRGLDIFHPQAILSSSNFGSWEDFSYLRITHTKLFQIFLDQVCTWWPRRDLSTLSNHVISWYTLYVDARYFFPQANETKAGSLVKIWELNVVGGSLWHTPSPSLTTQLRKFIHYNKILIEPKLVAFHHNWFARTWH